MGTNTVETLKALRYLRSYGVNPHERVSQHLLPLATVSVREPYAGAWRENQRHVHTGRVVEITQDLNGSGTWECLNAQPVESTITAPFASQDLGFTVDFRTLKGKLGELATVTVHAALPFPHANGIAEPETDPLGCIRFQFPATVLRLLVRLVSGKRSRVA